MKILFLTTEGFDTPGPNNQMAMVMIREFLNKGCQVHLIQSRRKRLFHEIPDMLNGFVGLSIDTLDRKVIDKTRFVTRYLDEVKWAFRSFSKWRKVKDVDVVFLQSCPAAVVQLVLLKIFKRKPVLFNIYDMWPGHACDLGVVKRKSLYNTFGFIQKIAYGFSSRISVLSEDMEQKLLNEGVDRKKIRVVPAWYDDTLSMEIPTEKNRFIQKYNIKPSCFFVQYAGTIGYVFDYRTVLETAELLRDDSEIRFQMIGDGAFKDLFVREAKERGLENIDFYPLQPLEMVPDVYSACDICIIPLRKGVIGNGVPSKVPLLMACHKVIINSVEEESVYYRMFSEYKMGISVPQGNAAAMAGAIRYLYKNPQVLAEMAERAKDYSKEHYTATVCTAKFVAAFEEMVAL